MNDFIPAPNFDPYQMLMSTEKILLRLPFFDDNKCSCSYLNIHLISLALSYESGNLNPRILAMQVCA